jgi:hypothetical protein
MYPNQRRSKRDLQSSQIAARRMRPVTPTRKRVGFNPLFQRGLARDRKQLCVAHVFPVVLL